MSRLDEAAKRVPADSSPADDEVLEPADDLNIDANPAGDAGDSDDEQGEGKERTAENVRREVLRKMEKSNKEMMDELKALRAENARMSQQFGTPAPTPASNAPKTFDDMSVQELINIQGQVPEAEQAAFAAYLSERKIDAKVDEKLNKFQSQTKYQTDESRFNEQAFDRWPQLRQKSSEFYGIADRILSEMGTRADQNPRAVLDAANEAGLELGLAPATALRRDTRRSPGKVAPGRSTKGTDAPTPAQTEADKAIASRLQNAMPGRKFTEKQLKRIAKRSKLYQEQINSHLRG